MLRVSSVIILLSAVIVNLVMWGLINKPYSLTESRYPVNSLSFNPYKIDQSPFKNPSLTPEEIESDLKLLADKTRTVRLYTSRAGMEVVPELAKKYRLNVIVSAYLDNPATNYPNKEEVEAAIQTAGKNKNVSRVILGNETQLHKTVPREELVGYLREARKRLKTPVSTAEPWDFWINNPEMVNEVDYIAIHILPYWVEVPIDEAVGYTFGKYKAVKDMFPHKMVMIAEAGWPSDGPPRGPAKPSVANQARFVRDFIQQAEAQKINYNIIEAFDQPWKSQTEGQVGEHWGLMDARRLEKFSLKGPVLEDPKWKYWAMTSTFAGLFASALFIVRRPRLKKRGQFFSVIIFQLIVAFAVQLAREATNQYMSPGDIVFWAIMVILNLLLAVIFLTDAIEIADVVGHKPLHKSFKPLNVPAPPDAAFVSVHLACCNEPPEMVIATLNSLAAMDYPHFEVIVVDNNTPDESKWRPVEARCHELGKHFRFFSLGKWPGYKAGALNFALRQTDPRAQVVGVVDADYVLEKNWLQATIPYFSDPEVVLVQAPQEHRDCDQSLFHQMENDEYSGFFRIGMVQRNEDNAIIQHGTMTLVRRATLDQLSGWAEWCICEDSELGLRLLALGKKSIYIDHAFGRGLVPDSYEAYSKQRYRWAYGAMRILRGHVAELIGWRGKMNWSQRYHFVKGWLPWIGDSLHLFFTLCALVWSSLLIWKPLQTDFPEPIFIYPALALVFLRVMGTFMTYTARVKIGRWRTILAMIAGGSLTHKIAKAVFLGLFTNSLPFHRTPKMVSKAPLLKNLYSIREELALTILLWTCAFWIVSIFGRDNRYALIWSIALLAQTFPYLSSIAAALASSLSRKRKTSKL